jgi:hypothetical protein
LSSILLYGEHGLREHTGKTWINKNMPEGEKKRRKPTTHGRWAGLIRDGESPELDIPGSPVHFADLSISRVLVSFCIKLRKSHV